MKSIISNRSVSMLVAVAMVFVAVSSHYQQRREETPNANEQSIADERSHHIMFDCMKQLKMYPMNKGLTRTDFASLVDAFSHSKTREGNRRLPLRYSLLFNMNACLNSNDCIGENATISVESQAEKEFTCMSFASLLVEDSMQRRSDHNETSEDPFETAAEL